MWRNGRPGTRRRARASTVSRTEPVEVRSEVRNDDGGAGVLLG